MNFPVCQPLSLLLLSTSTRPLPPCRLRPLYSQFCRRLCVGLLSSFILYIYVSASLILLISLGTLHSCVHRYEYTRPPPGGFLFSFNFTVTLLVVRLAANTQKPNYVYISTGWLYKSSNNKDMFERTHSRTTYQCRVLLGYMLDIVNGWSKKKKTSSWINYVKSTHVNLKVKMLRKIK